MDILLKSSHGIAEVNADASFLMNRKIFIDGEITTEMALRFMKQVLLLSAQSESGPIDVYITSPGGEVMAGFMIYDTIQGSKAPIRLFCCGMAYSMAAVLLCCGTKGQRYILPNSKVMLHEPLLGNQIGGSSSSIKTLSDSLLETRRKLNGVLAKHTGRTMAEMEKATEFDHYFTAEEAVAFGLCDKIVKFSDMM